MAIRVLILSQEDVVVFVSDRGRKHLHYGREARASAISGKGCVSIVIYHDPYRRFR